MRRWTGCSSARERSRRSSPRGTCPRVRSRSTTCARATSKARAVRWPRSATAATARRTSSQVNYGLLTTRAGCPVAVSVYEGNTADAKTLMPQVTQLREQFGLERLVLVGDRGMISHKAIDELRELDGLAWITALKSSQIRALVQGGALQLGLFDERNLFEFSHPDYPGERLIACRNPHLGKLRAHKREALLGGDRSRNSRRCAPASRTARSPVATRSACGSARWSTSTRSPSTLRSPSRRTALSSTASQKQIAAEAALDGIYVIRTSVPKKQMSSAEAVRSYKALAEVERAFRSLKTIDLKMRPIHHRLEERVRAHIFLCMLAYYVEWHMREAWRELLFADEDLERKEHRDPVAPAERSEAALEKVATRTLKDGSPCTASARCSQELSTIVRNTCEARDGKCLRLHLPDDHDCLIPRSSARSELLQSITV